MNRSGIYLANTVLDRVWVRDSAVSRAKYQWIHALSARKRFSFEVA